MSCSNCDQCARCGEDNLENRAELLLESFAARYWLKQAIALIREATELEPTTDMYKKQKEFLTKVENYEPSKLRINDQKGI